MGTNYYWRLRSSVPSVPPAQPCPHCGHVKEANVSPYDEGIHIGKSSSGWCFALHVYPYGDNDHQLVITTLDDWKHLWLSDGSRVIVDEYGVFHSTQSMLSIITNRQSTRTHTAFDYTANNALPGPNGLLRHDLHHGYCWRHGPGTWDLLTGDFS